MGTGPTGMAIIAPMLIRAINRAEYTTGFTQISINLLFVYRGD
jgi:hypothetical protein